MYSIYETCRAFLVGERFHFMEKLVAERSSISLGCFKLYEFSPSASCMGKKKLMFQIEEKNHPILKKVGASIIGKQQAEGDPHERLFGFIQKKRSPTRGIGLLYFILMDIYLVLLDEIIYSAIREYELQFNEELERLKPDPGDSHELLLNKASRLIFESRFPRVFLLQVFFPS